MNTAKKEPAYGRGFLLIANPNLKDPNFKRRVVLLCDHNNEGSYGLVLNQPTRTPLSELFSKHAVLHKETQHIYVGGPCQIERVQMLHCMKFVAGDSIRICDKIFMAKNLEAVLSRQTGLPEVNTSFRFFMGYSGWGAGQLQEEMKSDTWIVWPASNDIVFGMPVEKMWAEVLKKMGGYFAFLASMPPDVRVN